MNRSSAINLPPAVLWLAAAFIGIHVLRQVIGESLDERVVLSLAFTPARYGPIGEMLPGGTAARLWTPVSYTFLHADIVHLLVNVVWMASFGGALARRFGSMRFLLLSLVSTIAGAGLHFLAHASDAALVIGASGAVSGMVAATARFAFSPGGPLAGGANASFHNRAEPLASLLRNRRAVAFIIVWFVINILFGFVGGLAPGVPGPIAWEAHIGGFLAGFLMFPLLDPARRDPTPGEGLASRSLPS